jgi:hypothetical protein
MSIPTDIVIAISSINDLLPPVIKVNDVVYKVQES